MLPLKLSNGLIIILLLGISCWATDNIQKVWALIAVISRWSSHFCQCILLQVNKREADSDMNQDNSWLCRQRCKEVENLNSLWSCDQWKLVEEFLTMYTIICSLLVWYPNWATPESSSILSHSLLLSIFPESYTWCDNLCYLTAALCYIDIQSKTNSPVQITRQRPLSPQSWQHWEVLEKGDQTYSLPGFWIIPEDFSFQSQQLSVVMGQNLHQLYTHIFHADEPPDGFMLK